MYARIERLDLQNSAIENTLDAIRPNCIQTTGRLADSRMLFQEIQPLGHSFDFPSKFSRTVLTLTRCDDDSLLPVVIKRYGRFPELLEGGYETATPRKREIATQMAEYTYGFYQQLNRIGLNVATVHDVEAVPVDDSGEDNYAIRVRQEFMAAPNFVRVWQAAIQKKDEVKKAELTRAIFEVAHRVTNFPPDAKDKDLFPYVPKDETDSPTGIDLKPNNFMIQMVNGRVDLVLVDVYSPLIKLANGDFCFIDLERESGYPIDQDWEHLPERLGTKIGLYPKAILELAACAGNCDKAEILSFLERELQDYLTYREPEKVLYAVQKEILSGYKHYLSIAGAGERERFKVLNPERISSLDLVFVNRKNISELDRAIESGLFQLYKESFPGHGESKHETEENFRSEITSDRGFAIFVYENGQIVGMIRGIPLDAKPKIAEFFRQNGRNASDFFYLHTFGVGANYRSKGIGTKMLHAACAFIPKEFTPLIAVYEDNPRAQKLYEGAGFVELPFKEMKQSGAKIYLQRRS